MARSSFLRWVESIKQQNVNAGGSLQAELAEAEKAYSEFAKTDPHYIEACAAILPAIRNSPGLLQTDLYKSYPEFKREQLSYVLYFAAEHGKIKRIKKGRTYALSAVGELS